MQSVRNLDSLSNNFSGPFTFLSQTESEEMESNLRGHAIKYSGADNTRFPLLLLGPVSTRA